MKGDVRIEWSPKKLEKALQENKKHVEEGMEKALQEAIDLVTEGGQDILSRRTMTSGNKRIIDSLNKGSSTNISKVLSSQKAQVGTSQKGANFVKEGTRPFSPPRIPIWYWVRDELKASDVRGVTEQVRASIAREGIKATNFLTKGLSEKESQVQKAVEQAADNILKDMGLN